MTFALARPEFFASDASEHMKRPCAMIASFGLKGVTLPVPSSSADHCGQVSGSNCAMPSA